MLPVVTAVAVAMGFDVAGPMLPVLPVLPVLPALPAFLVLPALPAFPVLPALPVAVEPAPTSRFVLASAAALPVAAEFCLT